MFQEDQAKSTPKGPADDTTKTLQNFPKSSRNNDISRMLFLEKCYNFVGKYLIIK
jgi:hypothetical protein